MIIAILVADGFEEIEVSVPYDLLKRCGLNVITVGTNGISATGSHGLQITTDKLLKEVDTNNLDALIIPGGYPGYANLSQNKHVIETVQGMAEAGKYLAAICGGPVVLEKSGVIKNKKITCYPGMEGEFRTASIRPERVVVDGRVITSRSPGTALEFAYKLVELWLGQDRLQQLKQSMAA
jgi:4-methyl-5(b-hydroxyethyl)-thiazole monophosphate biosynthesis